jgi:hypothetical protein
VANAFLKAERIISQGLGLLQRELILPRLVVRYGKADFLGAKDDTINIRIPSLLKGRDYQWRTRTAAIIVDELDETSIPITLNKHPYSAVSITDEELTLDITSWGEQVAVPQTRAVAEKLESYIAAAMAAANFRHEVAFVEPDYEAHPDSRAFYATMVKARQALNEENVPAEGRVAVLGSAVEAAALQSKHLLEADKSAFDGTLREGIIGRIAGFTVIGNVNSVPPTFGVAMHPTAFALGNVAPDVPSGVSAGAGLVFDSLAMRWIRDYDPDHLRDRSVYSAFAGAASVEDGRDLVSPVGSGFGELTDENVRSVKINFTPLT